MPLTITETFESGNGSLGLESEDQLSAFVYGDPIKDNADDEATVTIFALQHFSPITKLGNVITTLDRVRLFQGYWRFTALYKSPTFDRQTGDTAFSFTTGGGTQHISCSRRTVGNYPPGAPDHQGAIGVNESGQPDGVDIHVPTFDFKITFYPPPAVMTPAFCALLKSLTAHANTDVVICDVDGVQFTFQPGELLYLNAEGSKRRGYGDWELTLNFSSLNNASNLPVGPHIVVPTKKGWDYLWIEYQGGDDGKNLISTPKAAHVEEVYLYGALTPLLVPAGYASPNLQNWRNPIINTGGGGVS